jgi:AcrR family transcriptional regulator
LETKYNARHDALIKCYHKIIITQHDVRYNFEMKVRARSVKDKEARAGSLLRSVEDLAAELGGVRFITLKEVTERAGIHRTGVRRYYSCKEELLLELAEAQWEKWRLAIEVAITGDRVLNADEVAKAIASTIASLPVFCDLLTHVALSLEGDVDIERARKYKLKAFREHDVIVDALVSSSIMKMQEVQQVMAASLFLAAGLWQVSHPTATLTALYKEVPDWGHVALNFEPRLTELLIALARGLVIARDEPTLR